ncbi:helix-turn-helix transcriptional regulator, partial [Thermobifida halotolerans]|uniref:helix-turn-helix transcriptional regulator n=1 Tax=Thermobifida halotolerans TaxID=483545 RepID=UPI0012F47B10
MTCANCGRDRDTRSCGCVPTVFWQRDDVREAVARSDVTRIVRLLRVHTDLTQEAIANLTGLSQGMVSQMESGKRSLRDTAKKRRAMEGLGAPSHLSLQREPPERSLTDWLATKLRYRRKFRGLSQHELATRTDADVSVINQIEAAARHCPTDLAWRLDEVLDTGGV